MSSSDTYYFVLYWWKTKERIGDLPHHGIVSEGNIILRNVHPVVWASRPVGIGITTLLFWSEIPESIALDKAVQGWCSCE